LARTGGDVVDLIPEGGSVQDVDISSNGLVAIAMANGAIALYRADDGEHVRTLLPVDDTNYLSFDRNGNVRSTVDVDQYLMASSRPKFGEPLAYGRRFGVVNANGLRIRSSSNLDSRIVGALQRGDRVQIHEESEHRTKVGDHNTTWYLVETFDGEERGWSYGAFINAMATALPEERLPETDYRPAPEEYVDY
jgi:hypothetical protein